MANNQLANKVYAAGDKAQYDACAKNLLSQKIILAWILKYCTEEFREFDISDILEHIEAPQVANVPVHQNTSDALGDQSITGLNTEDKPIDEAKVLYDIRFHAWVPGSNQQIRLLINVEAQKKTRTGYSLLKRAIYYCCRLISQQFGQKVSDINYDGIEKVYSIWICETAAGSFRNTINSYSIEEKYLLGEFKEKDANYDLITAVMVGLDTEHKSVEIGNEKSDNEKLIGMLSTLLSSVKKPTEKIHILENTYKIKTTKEMKEGVSEMCNLSDSVEERGIQKGMQQGIQKGMQQGMQQANAKRLAALMKRMSVSFDRAIELLEIDPSEREMYKQLVEQLQAENKK